MKLADNYYENIVKACEEASIKIEEKKKLDMYNDCIYNQAICKEMGSLITEELQPYEANIKRLMSYEKFEYMIIDSNNNIINQGIIIGIGPNRLFYNLITGKIHMARKYRGIWKIGDAISCNTTSDYCWVRVPGTSFQPAEHVVAAVALGMFDNIANIKSFSVNHKNYNQEDNKPSNIEVVLRKLNNDHRDLRILSRKLGIWQEGISIPAVYASIKLVELKDQLKNKISD